MIEMRSDASDKEPSKHCRYDRTPVDHGQCQNNGNDRQNKKNHAKHAAFALLDSCKSENTGKQGQNADRRSSDRTDIQADNGINGGKRREKTPDNVINADDDLQNIFCAFLHNIPPKISTYIITPKASFVKKSQRISRKQRVKKRAKRKIAKSTKKNKKSSWQTKKSVL